jgi:hypothetical protein
MEVGVFKAGNTVMKKHFSKDGATAMWPAALETMIEMGKGGDPEGLESCLPG